METTSKSLRLQIGIFGRTNVGKSSFLNMLTGQDVAITSSVPGTTTDVVEKSMELLPLGPVVFLDTAGLDDVSLLGAKRVERARRALDRSDVALVLVEPNVWGDEERLLAQELRDKKKPFIIIVNKSDLKASSDDSLNQLRQVTDRIVVLSSVAPEGRAQALEEIKRLLISVCPEDFLRPPALLGDLVPSGGLAVLVVPIDLQAPKGRLILPQVQAIRDALDNDAATLVVKEREYAAMLARLKALPDLVVCDSQVVMKTVADTPEAVKCTTFSILFARFKGDLIELAKGAAHIEALKPGDKVLIAESCSHHAAEDDIGRVKIPRWLRQYVGGDLQVDHFSGRDYPKNLSEYKLIVHCGSCMLTRGEMLLRIHQAKEKGVPITNYGVGISFVQGVLRRALSPFPAALDAFNKEMLHVRK
ncbi:MAG: [FeFe] hydrogenase H-cluster maturation GTPase HydF [Candidatus Omnitrophica bacterium]|nr:[FeFe] hydrogenase H-cluster maturation GTPase HydF [Candidatus Omnitrophota bacterium]